MDKLLFKFLQKELELLFEGFKEDDLNTNFLKGNLELTNLRLNTNVLQDALTPFAPYVQVESAVVEKLKLRVPFSSIKTKPVEVEISRLDVVIKEPLHYYQVQDLLKQALGSGTKKEKPPKTHKLNYTLFDRVLDGVQVKIGHIHISWSLLGLFKHAKPGPWTPHVLEINIYDLEVYSTNENWEQVELKKTREFTHEKPHIWHFKEGVCKVSAKFVPPKDVKTNLIPMDTAVLFDKLPVKVHFTQQRLNADEVIAMELSVIVDDVKISFTPSQMAHVYLWVNSLISAAFRKDLKKEKTKEEREKKEKEAELARIASQTDPGPNVLLNVYLNKLSIDFREKGKKDEHNLRFELLGLQMNRVLEGNKFGETFSRVMISQMFMRDVKQDYKLLRMYFKDSNTNEKKVGEHLLLHIPSHVQIHPTRIPVPSPLHFCMTLLVRHPEPEPPKPAFEYSFRMDSFELLLERDAIERLGIFMFETGLINANRPTPTAVDYINNQEDKLEKRIKDGGVVSTSATEKGVQFLELDLLANPKALISLDANLKEFAIKIPTPGGYDKACLELKLSHVWLVGSPDTAPAVYKKDFLSLKSNNGTCLVLEHDFYYQKFKDQALGGNKEYTLKFNLGMNSMSINMYDTPDSTEAQLLCAIKDVSSYCKIYSMARYIPDRATIPQVESNIIAEEVVTILTEKQYHQAVQFLTDHFLYGASSPLKSLLEEEIKILAATDKTTHKVANEDPAKKKRFLLLPTYMISAAVDKINVVIKDNTPKEVVSIKLTKTEAIIEKHDDRQVIIGRIQDLRIFSLPDVENSIMWLEKKKLPNAFQLRTEWRKLYEGAPTTTTTSTSSSPATSTASSSSSSSTSTSTVQKKQSYFLGSTEGIRLNLDVRNVYNMKDFLVHVLAESYVLAERSRNSHFIFKVLKYLDILYVTGMPSEVNRYWRELREVKLFLEQWTDIFFDINWDLEFSDVKVSIGDDLLKVYPFMMEKLIITTLRNGPKSKISLDATGLHGLITTTSPPTEESLAVPMNSHMEYGREKNPKWQPGNGEPEWNQCATIETNVPVQVELTPTHVGHITAFIQRHQAKLKAILTELMENADTEAEKSFFSDDNSSNSSNSKLSAGEVGRLQTELDKTKTELKLALEVQADLSTKSAQLQLENFELSQKYEVLDRKAKEYEEQMLKLSKAMMELQMKLAGAQ